jgi:hypothetical protein
MAAQRVQKCGRLRTMIGAAAFDQGHGTGKRTAFTRQNPILEIENVQFCRHRG